jgi:NAD(P)-dependent dehydrogenase (short-subunit alcohol dehydrogenase family)
LLATGSIIDTDKTVLITGGFSGIERMSAELFGGERMDVVAISQPRRRIFKNNRICHVFYSAERILAILSALGGAL